MQQFRTTSGLRVPAPPLAIPAKGELCNLVTPLGRGPGVMKLEMGETDLFSSVHKTLKLAEDSLRSRDPGASFEVIRGATRAIACLPRESETSRRAAYALQVVLAAFTGMTGDVAGHAVALQTAARQFMADPCALPPESRLRLSSEVALLLSRAGASDLAACLMSRIVAYAEEHADEPVRIAARLLRAEICLEARETMEPQLHNGLVRLSDPDGQLPRLRPHAVQGMDSATIKSLLRAAERVGAEDLVARANLVHAWVEYPNSGKLGRMLSAAEQLGRVGVTHGPWFLHSTARVQLGRAQVAGRLWEQAATTLQPSTDPRAWMPDWMDGELNFLGAAVALGRGDSMGALSSYSRYAQTAVHLRGIRERLVQSGIQSIAVLATSLPMTWPAAAKRGMSDALAICTDTIRIHSSSQSLLSLTAVAAAQGVTLRRIQQAFKLLGLPTPAALLTAMASDVQV